MKAKNLLVCVATLLLTTSCFTLPNPQFLSMPEGPLQSFHFWHARLGIEGEPILDVCLTRFDSLGTTYGKLTYNDNAIEDYHAMPQPLMVSAAVLDTVYNMVDKDELYKLNANYSTTLKGDSYAYVPWGLEVVLRDDVIKTFSDGTDPHNMYWDQLSHAAHYLRDIFMAEADKWVETHPDEVEAYRKTLIIPEQFGDEEVNEEEEVTEEE